MLFVNLVTVSASLAVTFTSSAAASTVSSNTIDVAFYTSNDCGSGYIETGSVAVGHCFALTDDTWFGSYLVPSYIPESLLSQGLQLEAGDTNPVHCSVGRCVVLSESLGCQPALANGETAWWFGMIW